MIGQSVEQPCKHPAELSEEAAHRPVIRRCRLRASRFRSFVRGRRKRSGQSRSRSWTRIERPSTHILNRRRRRVAPVEHERRLHLYVKFIRRNGGIR